MVYYPGVTLQLKVEQKSKIHNDTNSKPNLPSMLSTNMAQDPIPVTNIF
jgi:hypothetical protein